MKSFNIYDKVKYTGSDPLINKDRDYIITSCDFVSDPAFYTQSLSYTIYSRPMLTMKPELQVPVTFYNISSDYLVAMGGSDDINLDNDNLLNEFEKMLEDDDDELEFCTDFLNDNEDPPPVPEKKSKEIRSGVEFITFHKGHKIVKSISNNKSFLYCRDCKVEVE